MAIFSKNRGAAISGADDDFVPFTDETNETPTAVPSGAFALAGIAVALLVLAWLVVYAAEFLPRGMLS